MPFIEHAGQRLLYLHVPKTGGGSIEAWMASIAPLRFWTLGIPTSMSCTPQHLRMTDLRHLFGPDFFPHAVMTVRNPYDRVASEYRMHAHLWGEGFWQAFPSFSYWLETHLAKAAAEPSVLDNHMRPQWEFGGSGVEVLRFEDGLPAILSRIAAILGLPAPATVPHKNVSPGTVPVVEWDQTDRIRVAEFYARDFSQFGYDPGV